MWRSAWWNAVWRTRFRSSSFVSWPRFSQFLCPHGRWKSTLRAHERFEVATEATPKLSKRILSKPSTTSWTAFSPGFEWKVQKGSWVMFGCLALLHLTAFNFDIQWLRSFWGGDVPNLYANEVPLHISSSITLTNLLATQMTLHDQMIPTWSKCDRISVTKGSEKDNTGNLPWTSMGCVICDNSVTAAGHGGNLWSMSAAMPDPENNAWRRRYVRWPLSPWMSVTTCDNLILIDFNYSSVLIQFNCWMMLDVKQCKTWKHL